MSQLDDAAMLHAIENAGLQAAPAAVPTAAGCDATPLPKLGTDVDVFAVQPTSPRGMRN